MKVQVQARTGAADARLKGYAQAKLERLGRHFEHILEARLDLGTEKNRSLENRKVAHLTVHVHGTILKAEQTADAMQEAVDLVIDKMDRQISKFKEKVQDKGQARQAALQRGPMPPGRPAPPDARVKRFHLHPMRTEEAQAEMEKLGHTFFVFWNREAAEFNVIYRRRDGSTGRIEAVLP
jgi:putative sigma-54 modulation protein